MGFSAPSARQVYEYVLRLDDSPRALTDRFGWSVLLVGGYAEVAQEFLYKYGLDLCARTADRVRFVFFADVDGGGALTARRAARRRGGLLGAVLRGLRLDFRDRGWDVLRPDSLDPVVSEEDFAARVERWNRRVLPGAHAGLEFAQRLGIGRHVPCLVVFTDIGDLGVHVLPFEEIGADEAYRRVRAWIDEFYEVNHDVLARWTRIEQQVARLVSALAGSLWAVREWPTHQRAAWRELRAVAALAAAPPGDLAALDEVLAGEARLPASLRDELAMCRRRLSAAADRLAAAERMTAAAGELAATDDNRVLRRVLGRLTGDAPLRLLLDPDAASALAAARAVFVRDDVAELRNWRQDNGKLFAMPVFTAARQSWRWIAEQGRLPRETPARHRQRDFSAFNTALAAQPLARPSGEIADAVLAALAAHHGVTDEGEWRTATAGFRAHLVDAVDRLKSGAPADFTLVGHCLPFVAPPPRSADGPRARRRDELVRALRRSADRQVVAAHERETVLAAVPVLAEGHRAELEARLATAAPPELTGGAAVAELTDLVAVLDEYDDAVRSVVHPHLSDPELVPVAGRVADAAGLADRPRPADRLRPRAAWTVETYRRLARERPTWRTRTPADVLADALVGLRRDGGGEPRDALRALGVDDLAVVAQRLGVTAGGPPERVRAAVLTAVGMAVEDDPLGPTDVAAVRRLARKVADAEFDVFMAHHSVDKPAVRELCDLLRRHGVHPWLDVEQVRPGTWFQDVIAAAIRTARTAAVCVGPNGVGGWQSLEVRTFVERCVSEGVPVIPVLLPGVAEVPAGLPFLRQLDAVRFERSVREAEPLRRLLWGVTGERP
ncbi:toll/interleukin-1 receptor domain-containing protein [Saccharothrix obliqua]|uniref:toll/interleukin-1 receptor domain-containing protein n=1 Tax=Saccharothrix obliqua TaxID=2861747 RepID=UPI001C5ED1BE|nr:toll/interleukin-1 receptor domain-containing protein [Saccharothrix obliqua]MBW4718052.1 toll/interleukin-1 receptor domain-containing protein [Saccharothrix obliqua]